MKIYHNPRCAKSRQTLNIIREAGQEPEIVEYLKTPPSTEELQEIFEKGLNVIFVNLPYNNYKILLLNNYALSIPSPFLLLHGYI